jgi:hypothetical protein
MDKVKKRWLWIIGGVVLILLLWRALFPSPWANAATVKPTDRQWIERSGPVQTYTVARQLNPCDRYNNGEFKGWIGHNVTYRGGPFNEVMWRFGTSLTVAGYQWAGSFCYNNRHIWRLDYGGEPPGWANWTGAWHYDIDKTKVADNDGVGDHQHRIWRTRFYSAVGPVGRDCFPRLGIGYNTGGRIDYYEAENC